jgi:SAM-dependent methyltransferase
MSPPPPHGGYDRLEIVQEGVDWCQQNLTPHFPHFRFHQLDIYNKLYNPNGKMQSSEVTFPFEAETFDVIVLTSVFTHRLEQDVERYYSEIERVLKPDGRVYSTLFILNDESKKRRRGVGSLPAPLLLFRNPRAPRLLKAAP